MAESFKVKNAAGHVFTVYDVPGRRIGTRTLASRRDESVAGIGSYKLEDGTHLNPQDDGTFLNIRTQEVLTRV